MTGIKVWLMEWVVKRAVPRAVAGLVGLMSAKGIVPMLASYGVTIDPQKFEMEMTVLALMGSDMVLRWIKRTWFNMVTKPAEETK